MEDQILDGNNAVDSSSTETPESTGALENTGDGEEREGYIPRERFDEVNERMKAAEDRAAQMQRDTYNAQMELARMRGQFEGVKQPESKQPDYQDVSKMSADELLDVWDKDPISVLANVARQTRAEVRAELQQELKQELGQFQQQQTQRQAVDQFANYIDKNPDIKDYYKSGQLEAVMRENGGINPMAAHKLIKAERELEAKVTEAVKKKEEEMTKNMKAKQGLKPLGGGPATPRSSTEKDDRLSNPAKHGGDISVLVQRMSEREAEQ